MKRTRILCFALVVVLCLSLWSTSVPLFADDVTAENTALTTGFETATRDDDNEVLANDTELSDSLNGTIPESLANNIVEKETFDREKINEGESSLEADTKPQVLLDVDLNFDIFSIAIYNYTPLTPDMWPNNPNFLQDELSKVTLVDTATQQEYHPDLSSLDAATGSVKIRELPAGAEMQLKYTQRTFEAIGAEVYNKDYDNMQKPILFTLPKIKKQVGITIKVNPLKPQVKLKADNSVGENILLVKALPQSLFENDSKAFFQQLNEELAKNKASVEFSYNGYESFSLPAKATKIFSSPKSEEWKVFTIESMAEDENTKDINLKRISIADSWSEIPKTVFSELENVDIAYSVRLYKEMPCHKLDLGSNLTSDVEDNTCIASGTKVNVKINVPEGYILQNLFDNRKNVTKMVKDNVYVVTMNEDHKLSVTLKDTRTANIEFLFNLIQIKSNLRVPLLQDMWPNNPDFLTQEMKKISLVDVKDKKKVYKLDLNTYDPKKGTALFTDIPVGSQYELQYEYNQRTFEVYVASLKKPNSDDYKSLGGQYEKWKFYLPNNLPKDDLNSYSVKMVLQQLKRTTKLVDDNCLGIDGVVMQAIPEAELAASDNPYDLIVKSFLKNHPRIVFSKEGYKDFSIPAVGMYKFEVEKSEKLDRFSDKDLTDESDSRTFTLKNIRVAENTEEAKKMPITVFSMSDVVDFSSEEPYTNNSATITVMKKVPSFYNLTLGENLTADIEANQCISAGTKVNVTVNIPEGFKLETLMDSNQDVTDLVKDNVYSFVMNEDHNLEATFLDNRKASVRFNFTMIEDVSNNRFDLNANMWPNNPDFLERELSKIHLVDVDNPELKFNLNLETLDRDTGYVNFTDLPIKKNLRLVYGSSEDRPIFDQYVAMWKNNSKGRDNKKWTIYLNESDINKDPKELNLSLQIYQLSDRHGRGSMRVTAENCTGSDNNHFIFVAKDRDAFAAVEDPYTLVKDEFLAQNPKLVLHHDGFNDFSIPVFGFDAQSLEESPLGEVAKREFFIDKFSKDGLSKDNDSRTFKVTRVLLDPEVDPKANRTVFAYIPNKPLYARANFKVYLNSPFHNLKLGEGLTADVEENSCIASNTEITVTINTPEGKELSKLLLNGQDVSAKINGNKFIFNLNEDSELLAVFSDINTEPTTTATTVAKTTEATTAATTVAKTTEATIAATTMAKTTEATTAASVATDLTNVVISTTAENTEVSSTQKTSATQSEVNNLATSTPATTDGSNLADTINSEPSTNSSALTNINSTNSPTKGSNDKLPRTGSSDFSHVTMILILVMAGLAIARKKSLNK